MEDKGNDGFLNEADRIWEGLERLAAAKDARIDQYVEYLLSEPTAELVDEANQEEGTRQTLLDAIAKKDFTAIGSFYYGKIERYAYKLADLEVD